MSSITWWILAGSIPLAVIIMMISFLVMRKKINKVKTESLPDNSDNLTSKALNREDHGLLLWDLKEKTKNPTPDQSMEFVINTMLRNKYKRLLITGFDEKYEETSLLKKTTAKISNATFDFALINFKENTIDEIDAIMKRAELKSMIMIVNAPKGRDVKKLLTYLKYTGVRNEYQKIDLGIILIAK